jgi:hypothetical protein
MRDESSAGVKVDDLRDLQDLFGFTPAASKVWA